MAVLAVEQPKKAKEFKADELIKSFTKNMGKGIVSLGGHLVDIERLPTGVFPFDLASGGGFPLGKIAIVYGPESSGKTNLLLRAMAMFQFIAPHLSIVFVDLEHAWDPVWAVLMGVDASKIIVIRPEYAEQAVDIVEGFMQAVDIGLVVVDSISAFITENESASSAEKAIVGGSAGVVGKLLRKTVAVQSRMAILERYPTLLCTSQTRMKIGVLHGDPETMTGGQAPKFYSSMTTRLYGKNIVEKAINPNLPAYKETSIIIKKWKVPIVATAASYQMNMIPCPSGPVGFVDDWATVQTYAKNYGIFAKADKGPGWKVGTTLFPTLDAIRSQMDLDPHYRNAIREEICSLALQDHTVAPQS
jgi:recombination protein RecA